MKIVAISAVTAGGKTSLVNEIKKRLPKTKSLHFDDYSFEGAVDNYYQWTIDGADVEVWNLTPLKKEIDDIIENNECDYLLLDYPFAYCHKQIKDYIDYAFFIDTPLDIAMARRVLRDMKNSTGEEIRYDMEMYLKYARIAYLQMYTSSMPSSDYVLDGTKTLKELSEEVIEIITK